MGGPMNKLTNYARRDFLSWACRLAVVAGATCPARGLAGTFHDLAFGANDVQALYKPKLLPTQQKVWADLNWMAELGPKFTGNPAHVKFVDFLADRLTGLKLQVTRDHYTFPRWNARRWAASVQTAGGAKNDVAVTSYFPYSGQTPREGVTGELVYVGKYPDLHLDNLQGKVALVDFVPPTRKFSEMYQLWGVNPPGDHFPDAWRPARAAVNELTKFKEAGAVAVILAWNEVSDANAADQYTPFSRPPQGVPGLYVGRRRGQSSKPLRTPRRQPRWCSRLRSSSSRRPTRCWRYCREARRMKPSS